MNEVLSQVNQLNELKSKAEVADATIEDGEYTESCEDVRSKLGVGSGSMGGGRACGATEGSPLFFSMDLTVVGLFCTQVTNLSPIRHSAAYVTVTWSNFTMLRWLNLVRVG